MRFENSELGKIRRALRYKKMDFEMMCHDRKSKGRNTINSQGFCQISYKLLTLHWQERQQYWKAYCIKKKRKKIRSAREPSHSSAPWFATQIHNSYRIVFPSLRRMGNPQNQIKAPPKTDAGHASIYKNTH